MAIVLHHRPTNPTFSWNIHVWQPAWDGIKVWDSKGTPNGDLVDFQLPDATHPRRLQCQFHFTPPGGSDTYERQDFIRRLVFTDVPEVWTFDSSARIIYQNPFPSGVVFHAGDVLTFHVITQARFRGGQIYAWNPYDPTTPHSFFGETSRDDTSGISTFQVTLADWMTSGFHLKLMQPAGNGTDAVWEPDASNRVWRPSDGAEVWLKSGQCDLRSQPLSLTPVPVEVLFSAGLASPPRVTLTDQVEGSKFSFEADSTLPFAGSPLFRVGAYTVPIYTGASYTVECDVEEPPIQRAFPAHPANAGAVSRFVAGASAWVDAFPSVTLVPLSVQSLPSSSFGSGLTVQLRLGNGPAYDTVTAISQPDGTWQAPLEVLQGTTTSLVLLPVAGNEPKPYDWIDTRRFFTVDSPTTALFTTEGVYGVCAAGPTRFANPPDRGALMRSAFGSAIVNAGIFGSREMPHGATVSGGRVYFVVHAPHAIHASLVLVQENNGHPVRQLVPMTLTTDTFYWWCSLPADQVPPGARYRFLLDDNLEVLDPAAREVYDAGNLDAAFNADPADPATSWSIVLDVANVSDIAHTQPWQTMGWQNFLIYEMHARRFSELSQGTLSCFDLLVDELNATSRLRKGGYLRQLPVTVFGLMPVNEFNFAESWGYDSSYYFAIDNFYGGSEGLAKFVNAAHANGRGVTLDLVYNHSLGSSLMKIAPDVYRNGDYDGDRMNCGHPMTAEYFRQASIYLFRTFNLDGFRFDDTQTIVTKCQGGWEFLGMIRASLRAAATAEARDWPYCVAENMATSPWDISNPGFGVMDGQWGIDEVFRIRDASYDVWHSGWNDAGPLKSEMDNPQYWGRPFFQAVRFGESHDMVSEQDSGNKRIAARPPFGEGFQMSKALGTLTLLSNGIPMLFMGQEVGETAGFSFSNNEEFINPQQYDLCPDCATDNTRILSWFRQLMGLRNDTSKGLQGEANYQVVATGNRTVAFTCGSGQRLFAVVTFGTPDQRQDSSWLGLPGGAAFKEIFNSSWPAYRVESEPEQTNGGYDAQIWSGQILNLPWAGAVVLERR